MRSPCFFESFLKFICLLKYWVSYLLQRSSTDGLINWGRNTKYTKYTVANSGKSLLKEDKRTFNCLSLLIQKPKSLSENSDHITRYTALLVRWTSKKDPICPPTSKQNVQNITHTALKNRMKKAWKYCKPLFHWPPSNEPCHLRVWHSLWKSKTECKNTTYRPTWCVAWPEMVRFFGFGVVMKASQMNGAVSSEDYVTQRHFYRLLIKLNF